MANLPTTHLDTLIVTVNYKTAPLVEELIHSLKSEITNLGTTHMVIVDNASNDNSIEYINDYIDKNNISWITVIQNPSNSGYAAGNNLGINSIIERDIDFKTAWFLNPDTKVRKNAGVELINHIKHNNSHIVGSRLEDEDGTPQSSHFNFPGIITQISDGLRLGIFDKVFKNKLITKPISNNIEQADWLSGASFMVTKQYIDTVGLMDDEYFLYFEELDYCLQGARNNMPCWHVPTSRVYHAVGAATGISDHRKKSPRRPQYWFDSRTLYFSKNYGALTLAIYNFIFILSYTTWLLRTYLTNKTKLNKEPPFFLRDFIKNAFTSNNKKRKD